MKLLRFLQNKEMWAFFVLAVIFNSGPLFGGYNLLILGEPSIPPFPSQMKSFQLGIWMLNNLGYHKLYTGGLPLNGGIWLLGNLGFSGGTIYNLLIIFSLFLSGFGTFKIVEALTRNKTAGLFAGVFYMSTPFLFHHIIFSHHTTIVAYAIAPWAVYHYLNFLWKGELKNLIYSGLSLGITALMINFLPMMAIIFASISLLAKGSVKHRMGAFVFTSAIAIFLNFYWILPAFETQARVIQFLKTGASSFGQLKNISPTPFQALIGVGLPSNLYQYSLGASFVFWVAISILLFLVVYIANLVYPRKSDNQRLLYSFIFLNILSFIWLTAFRTTLAPIAQVVYSKLPLMTVFRNVTHVYFVYSLSLSILLGEAIAIAFKRKPNFMSIQALQAVFLILLLVHSTPFLTGNYGNLNVQYNYTDDQREIINFLNKQKGDYRVLMFPADSIVRYEGKSYPNNIWGRDPILMYAPKPTFDLHSPSKRTGQFNINVQLSEMVKNNRPYSSEILSKLGVKYIILRQDPKGITGNDYVSLKNSLSKDDRYLLIKKGRTYMIFQNKDYNKQWRFSAGGIKVYDDLDFTLMLQESEGVVPYGSSIKTGFTAYRKIIVTPSGDLLYTYIGEANTVSAKLYPRFYTNVRNPYQGWNNGWQNAWWVAPDLSRYPYNPSITLKEGASIDIPVPIDKSGEYVVLIQFLLSKKGGKFMVEVGDTSKIFETIYGDYRYSWGHINVSIDKNSVIRIKNITGLNAINKIVVFPRQEFIRYKQEFREDISNDEFVYKIPIEDKLYPGERILKSVNVYKQGSFRVTFKADGKLLIQVKSPNNQIRSIEEENTIIWMAEGTQSIEIQNPADIFYYVREMRNLKPENPDFSISLSNDSTLKATTSETGKFWSWIRTEPVNILKDSCWVSTEMKFKNVKASHISVEGFNEITSSWKLLKQVPTGRDGTSDWVTYWAKINTENITKIRFALNAGGALELGNATTWFRNLRIYDQGPINISSITIRPAEEIRNVKAVSVEKYTRISPVKYKVYVNASEPYMLSFAEGYDPLWIAEIHAKKGAKQIEPTPLYGAINGFWIEQSSKYTITIRHRLQRWFHYGTVISGATFFVLLAYLFYDWRSKDEWAQRIRQQVHDQWSKIKEHIK